MKIVQRLLGVVAVLSAVSAGPMPELLVGPGRRASPDRDSYFADKVEEHHKKMNHGLAKIRDEAVDQLVHVMGREGDTQDKRSMMRHDTMQHLSLLPLSVLKAPREPSTKIRDEDVDLMARRHYSLPAKPADAKPLEAKKEKTVEEVSHADKPVATSRIIEDVIYHLGHAKPKPLKAKPELAAQLPYAEHEIEIPFRPVAKVSDNVVDQFVNLLGQEGVRASLHLPDLPKLLKENQPEIPFRPVAKVSDNVVDQFVNLLGQEGVRASLHLPDLPKLLKENQPEITKSEDFHLRHVASEIRKDGIKRHSKRDQVGLYEETQKFSPFGLNILHLSSSHGLQSQRMTKEQKIHEVEGRISRGEAVGVRSLELLQSESKLKDALSDASEDAIKSAAELRKEVEDRVNRGELLGENSMEVLLTSIATDEKPEGGSEKVPEAEQIAEPLVKPVQVAPAVEPDSWSSEEISPEVLEPEEMLERGTEDSEQVDIPLETETPQEHVVEVSEEAIETPKPIDVVPLVPAEQVAEAKAKSEEEVESLDEHVDEVPAVPAEQPVEDSEKAEALTEFLDEHVDEVPAVPAEQPVEDSEKTEALTESLDEHVDEVPAVPAEQPVEDSEKAEALTESLDEHVDEVPAVPAEQPVEDSEKAEALTESLDEHVDEVPAVPAVQPVEDSEKAEEMTESESEEVIDSLDKPVDVAQLLPSDGGESLVEDSEKLLSDVQKAEELLEAVVEGSQLVQNDVVEAEKLVAKAVEDSEKVSKIAGNMPEVLKVLVERAAEDPFEVEQMAVELLKPLVEDTEKVASEALKAEELLEHAVEGSEQVSDKVVEAEGLLKQTVEDSVKVVKDAEAILEPLRVEEPGKLSNSFADEVIEYSDEYYEDSMEPVVHDIEEKAPLAPEDDVITDYYYDDINTEKAGEEPLIWNVWGGKLPTKDRPVSIEFEGDEFEVPRHSSEQDSPAVRAALQDAHLVRKVVGTEHSNVKIHFAPASGDDKLRRPLPLFPKLPDFGSPVSRLRAKRTLQYVPPGLPSTDNPTAYCQAIFGIVSDNDQHLFQDPTDCTHFFYCQFGASIDSTNGTRETCPPGERFSNEILTCVLGWNPDDLCAPDPCEDEASEASANGCWVDETNCRRLFSCTRGGSFASCCPLGTRATDTCGCETSMTCSDSVCEGEPLELPTTVTPIINEDDTCFDSASTLLRPEGETGFQSFNNDTKQWSSFLCPAGTKFSLQTCVCSGAAGPQPEPPAYRKCDLYLPFDDDLQDKSLNRMWIQLHGAVSISDTAAVGSGSAFFNGGRLELSGFNNKDLGTTVSWCLMYRCSPDPSDPSQTSCASTQGTLMSNRVSNNPDYSFLMQLAGGSRQVSVETSPPAHMIMAQSNEPLSDDAWHQLCVEYNGVDVKLFEDGVLVDTVMGVGANKAVKTVLTPYTIGSSRTVDGAFVGYIDEVLVCGTLLSDDEMTAHREGDRAALVAAGLVPE